MGNGCSSDEDTNSARGFDENWFQLSLPGIVRLIYLKIKRFLTYF